MAKINKPLIRQNHLQKELGLSRSGFYNLRKNDPSFPRPLKFGTSTQAAVFYVRSEVDAWLEAQCRHRSPD